jgi:N-acetylglucosaminyl-diphospho-decaprenol L-rhamnosyltransferase
MGVSSRTLERDTRGAALTPCPPELSIIVVNWNSAEFVRRCVESIRVPTSDLACEIIVVDNASFDDCEKLLQKHAPDVKYIQFDKNLGFAKANNRAFQASCGASVLFLNPDTEIIGSAIGLLYRALQNLPMAGAVGARLLNGDGTLQTSCIQALPTILNQTLDSEFLRRKWPGSRLWGTKPFLHGDSRAAEVEGISGACLMIKRDLFNQIGGFSEDYFMYAEDMDLCFKIRKTGYKNYYVPEASVIHFGGGSSKQAPSNFSIVMMRESIWRYFRNTRGDLYGISYRLSMLLSALCRLVLLSISFFVQRFCQRRQSSGAAFRKWWTILRWSLSGGHSIRR